MTDALATTLSSARIAVVAYARSIVGLTTPDPDYLALVAPSDMPERQARIGDESGCMLVAMGIQEAVFMVPVRGPYVDGTAPRLLEARAGGYPWAPGGALRLATLETPPRPGDAVWWGKGFGGPEHVEHLVDGEVSGNDIAASMVAGGERWTAKDAADGLCEPGQVNAETVKIVARTLRWNGRQWTDPGTGRAIVAILDADLMATRYGLRGGS